MKIPRAPLLALALWILAPAPGTSQGTERWLYLPYGANPRYHKERIPRLPEGQLELKFQYLGKPPAIHRFGKSIAADYPVLGPTVASGTAIPTISEANRLLETLNQAALAAELAGYTETASDPGPIPQPPEPPPATATLASGPGEVVPVPADHREAGGVASEAPPPP